MTKLHLPLDTLAVPQLPGSSSTVCKGLWNWAYCEKEQLCTELAPKDQGRRKCPPVTVTVKALCHAAEYWDNVWISRGTEKRMSLLLFVCVYCGTHLS